MVIDTILSKYTLSDKCYNYKIYKIMNKGILDGWSM